MPLAFSMNSTELCVSGSASGLAALVRSTYSLKLATNSALLMLSGGVKSPVEEITGVADIVIIFPQMVWYAYAFGLPLWPV
jgi:type IV secretory pathway TrbD component